MFENNRKMNDVSECGPEYVTGGSAAPSQKS